MRSFLCRYTWLIAFFLAQCLFWYGWNLSAVHLPCHIDGRHFSWNGTRNHLPDMAIVPEVPGKVTVKALSFGDEEFYFRLLALDIQNAGDTYGRFTELYKYDYQKLYDWFTLLDTLDDESNYVPFIASYYYGQTQHVSDVRYVVDYLYNHSASRPGKKYWWLAPGGLPRRAQAQRFRSRPQDGPAARTGA